MGIEKTLNLVFDSDAGVEAIAATKGETVIGFGVLMISDAEGVANYFQGATGEYPIGEVNAVFHALAVEEDWEGRGLGSELMRHRLILARDNVGVDAAFGNAWLRPHTVDASVIFEKHGFQRLETIEQSFQLSSGERDCPDCAPDTCECSSAVYAKTFEED